ncbi:carotenoid isomerooxygenase [Sabethes cyaneus]|uniref:carotenoid isomerooxygenase n=1 Tax=Sabethes cyaneus TaxID=53552 RepID=UPI00237D97C7|nr:carotenoid isomerooxygenase [Sabethes cyaneus]
MDISVEPVDQSSLESPCPSPEVTKILNMDFLTINGRFTPKSSRSSACSTRTASVCASPTPSEADDNEDAGNDQRNRATPVFTWNPLPTTSSIVYAKHKDSDVKFLRYDEDSSDTGSSVVSDTEEDGKEEQPKELYPNCDVNVWLRSCEKEIVEPIEGLVKGEIPEWLNGSLLRNGPGSLKVGEMTFNHLFDSSALLHRFNIENGKVSYQCRFLKSDAYKRNKAAQRIVVTEFGTKAVPDPCHTIFNRIASLFRKPGENNSDNAMISIYPFGDEYFAFTESPIIHKINPETLNTESKLNVSDYVGIVNHTSHPHVMSDGTVYNLGCSVTKTGPAYTILCFPNGEHMFEDAHIVASVPARWRFHPGYMHTFGITEHFFIIVEQPLSISVPSMLMNQMINEPMAASLKWYDNEQTYIYLLDRDTGDLKHTYHAEPFFYLHIINQYEKDDHVVLDICCYKDPSMLNCMYIDTMKNMQQNPDYAKMFRGRPLRFVLPLDYQGALKQASSYSSFSVSRSLSLLFKKLSVNSENDEKTYFDDRLILKNLVKLDNTSATAYVMPNATIFCKPERLCDLGCETPRIYYEHHLGREYQYFYAISSDVDANNPGTLIKVDVVNKRKLTWCEENVYPSEPIFVPSPNPQTEDDGVVLAAMVWGREEENRVGLLVLDAKSFTEIARGEFMTPGPVPKCLHGWFRPTAKQD